MGKAFEPFVAGTHDGLGLRGLAALVTGGASGIGLATARMLASLGADVAVIDIAAGGPREFAYSQADIADDAAARAAVAELGDRVTGLGRIDIVVNNAAMAAAGSIEDNDDAQWLHVLDVNVVGLVRVTRAALPALRRSRAASIVNTCSISAVVGVQQRALYSATKGAVLALTRATAADLYADGIRVNAVVPGLVDTPWIDRQLAEISDPGEREAARIARAGGGRFATADEVAAAICYLASPAAAATTGSALPIDGGSASVRRS